MRQTLWAGLVLALTVVLAAGAGLAWWRTGQLPGDAQIIRNGVWWTTEAAGAADQSSSLPAHVARTGILALAQSEVIYFQTALDSEGRPLSTACDYGVEGRPVDAQWRSLTVYDKTTTPSRSRACRHRSPAAA